MATFTSPMIRRDCMQSDGHAHLDLFLPVLLLQHLGGFTFKLVAFTIGVEAVGIFPNRNVNSGYKCVQSTDILGEGCGIGRLIAKFCHCLVNDVPIIATWFVASTLPVIVSIGLTEQWSFVPKEQLGHTLQCSSRTRMLSRE